MLCGVTIEQHHRCCPISIFQIENPWYDIYMTPSWCSKCMQFVRQYKKLWRFRAICARSAHPWKVPRKIAPSTIIISLHLWFPCSFSLSPSIFIGGGSGARLIIACLFTIIFWPVRFHLGIVQHFQLLNLKFEILIPSVLTDWNWWGRIILVILFFFLASMHKGYKFSTMN